MEYWSAYKKLDTGCLEHLFPPEGEKQWPAWAVIGLCMIHYMGPMTSLKPEEDFLYIYKTGCHPGPEVLLRSPVKC